MWRALRRRRAIRAGRALVQGPLERCDPALGLLRRRARRTRPPPLALIGVYRVANAAHIRRIATTVGSDARVALWGLDGVDPALAPVTAGAGPGDRLTLLNRLLRSLDLPFAWWLLVSDDDVDFKRGGPGDLLCAAAHLRLDLAQPAHAWNSEVSHRFARRRMLMLARRTGWVEQGPVLLLAPLARERLLPFPEDVAWPAWGIEARWSREERRGLRLGIVDAVTVVHAQPAGASGYARDRARREERRRLREAGFASNDAMQIERSCWRPWSLEGGLRP